MNDEFRRIVIEALRRGEDLPADWARELFPPEKREYELVYHGKEREEEILAETMAVPLQPVSTFGKNGHDWHNMLIFGDNLQAMKTLLKMKEQGELLNADGTPGVRLVYIDPPFATKQDFRGTEDQKAYQDKIAGSQFLEFLRKRLVVMRELLSEDGYLFVHLDMKRCHYIKVLLDEIMGEQNFLNHVVWSYRRWPSICRNYQPMHDDILVYARSAKSPARFFETKYEDPSESYLKRFQGKTQVLDEETGTRKITIDAPTKGMPLRDVWDISIIAGFKGERTGYPTQKPEELLAQILKTCTRKGDLVLDGFAGSGTTPAVAEKLGRRWIAIDCGKFAIYTMQKRLLNLLSDIGHYGAKLEPKPFTLYNAGLYDFSRLKQLPWADWRFFALQLFGCKDEPHSIGGLRLDGKLKGASVLVFNHLEHPGQRVDEDTVRDIHTAVGKKIGKKFFIIAARGAFDFQQDYVDLEGVRYYALRIPYSVINELHHREFSALQQPNDETAVNDTVDAVGFDFIQPPQVQWAVGIKKRKGQLLEEVCLKIKHFESRARLRGKDTRGGLETFSMLMLDFDYNGEVFDLDAVFYAHQLEADEWQAWFPAESVGANVMAVFIDIYGNEAREVIPRDQIGRRVKGAAPAKIKKKSGK